MGPRTMFKFVASDGIGSTQKRHQARRACENCRRRKKACLHTEPPPTSKSNTALDNKVGVRSPTSPIYVSDGTVTSQQQVRQEAEAQSSTPAAAEEESLHGGKDVSTSNEETHEAQTDLPAGSPRQISRRQEDPNSRFIGDLSPEGIFLAATSPDATQGGSVGVWLTTNAPMTSSHTSAHTTQSPSNLFYGTGSLVQQVLVPMLEQQCLSTLPPPAKVTALTKIYYDKVYPILPIVDEDDYQDLPTLDPHRILLQQGICLAASKNFAARQHLVLDESGSPLTCREFGERLSGAMRMSMEMGLVTNRVVMIQALGLLTQFADNPAGDDLSSQLCSRAIHHAQSIGLHLKEDQLPNSKRLCCCIWAIDRLNAALYGRPVLMHERDFRADFSSHFETQEPGFRLFLRVIELLDRVIEIFRPASSEDPILTWEFPSFEDVVLKCGVPNLSMSTLTAIETLYHAISILSCRSKTWADPQRSSTSFLRQSLSTATLSSTVINELQDHHLTLFPFIPYAMSLAMSISYREMRHSKLTLHRTRARIQFQTLCDALSKLDGIFWSASATSDMGKKLLREMDRVVSTVSNSSERRLEQHSAQSTENSSIAATAAMDHTMADDQNMLNGNGDVTAHTMQDVDPSIFESISDIDLFGMFDPAFDLDGFDACLEGNLNPALPTNFQ
ncbi:uncharacterized protein LY89DRAFT_664320 [Mollisia scopiformis]|uniref:Xylanolytic transcriptional activator regulatory domain-containing protein n=1 Tax=Mollisia scopiformis TaxID=149040 RepID=A0A194XR23_MOLSC|nr:uncharacterized protein LY89DRAFT_664320 [Mollisia scopiformis]KUJ22504.1 hypothetical protein LY89DRAFT_664320 [Mollisia scopiformis]